MAGLLLDPATSGAVEVGNALGSPAVHQWLTRVAGDTDAIVGTHVPYAARTAGPKAAQAFLSALFDVGSTMSAGSLTLGAVAPELGAQVQLLLLGMGLATTVVPSGSGARTSVVIAADDTATFMDVVGFRSDERATQVRDAASMIDGVT